MPDENCYKCELPMNGRPRVNHPILGPRHTDCGKVSKICPVCNLALPCECD